MKCQRCTNQATFHITELTGSEPQEVHLCEECAREYLAPSQEEMSEVVPALAGMLAEQLAVGQTAEELARLDQRACPVCGITFLEFRKQGRLGCPNDYVCFEKELEPLLANIHGETRHVGKVPRRCPTDGETQTRIIRLRREMKEAVATENYERASELRDQIRIIEAELRENE
jgi:protein arginine kinase activator